MVAMFLRVGLFLVALLSLNAGQMTKLDRGRYLVEEVAKCGDCHTPKGPDGQLDRSRWLKGAVLDFQPIEAVKGWHKTSPDLTRQSRLWMKWGERAFLTFLTTGLGPSGKPADPPMPVYKLRPDDAEAIIDYLKSLK